MPGVNTFARCLLASVAGNSSGVVFPTTANDYPGVVEPYNLDYPVIPAAVVFPEDTQQVAAAVKCAVDAGVKVQAKSGGHNYGNYGSSTGELSINLENLNHFSIDESTYVATIGPGNRLGVVSGLLYNNGKRHAPHGVCFNVGLGGHATVGGAGAASRRLGLTLDVVEEVEVVLANSSIVRASDSLNPDLFWAVRGAAASVGIVTEVNLKTYPAPPETVNYVYGWNASDIRTNVEIFSAWQRSLASLPNEVSSTLTVSQDTISLAGAYFGSQEDFDALDLIAQYPEPQLANAQVWTNFLDVSTSWSEGLDATGITRPAYFYAKSLFFRESTQVADDVLRQLFQYLATAKNGTNLWTINFEAQGGKIAEVPIAGTALPHRDAIFVMAAYARTSGRVTDTTVRFLDRLNEVITSGDPDAFYGEYAGYVDPRQDNDEARYNYFGPNLRRIEQIKAAVDPKDVFHNQQSVRPVP